jgi:ATPase subunit of ABC transporter with duplicated ATPase domains
MATIANETKKMPQITLQNVGVTFGNVLFSNLSFSLSEGSRIGVAGNNGAGKSTLLRCVAGLMEPSEGSIRRSKGIRLGYVEQAVPEALRGMTLRQAILDAIEVDERELVSWRVDLVLETFGAPSSMRDRALFQLSGGWQRLALIARAWVCDPDVVVIDEPTNHLDLAKILVLESWLTQDLGDTALLMVSHDRRFLDTCTNHTLFLRSGVSQMYSYPFSRARDLLIESDRALEGKKERELKEVQRLRKSAHKLRQIGVNNYSTAALRKSGQIARRAETIEESLTATHVEKRRDIHLASRDTHAKRIIGIERVTVCRPDGVPLFVIGKLEIWQGDRVVVLGRNGTGKTRFVLRLRAAFADREAARIDGIMVAPSAVMAYIDQEMSQLPNEETVGRYIGATYETGAQRATSLLVSAGFSIAQQARRIAELSPGEKARLALLAVRLSEPSFYLMDEPTNHLDITGQEQLEAEILAHAATAIFVSHDRALVENIGTRFLVVEGENIFELEDPHIFYELLTTNSTLPELAANIVPL